MPNRRSTRLSGKGKTDETMAGQDIADSANASKNTSDTSTVNAVNGDNVNGQGGVNGQDDDNVNNQDDDQDDDVTTTDDTPFNERLADLGLIQAHNSNTMYERDIAWNQITLAKGPTIVSSNHVSYYNEA